MFGLSVIGLFVYLYDDGKQENKSKIGKRVLDFSLTMISGMSVNTIQSRTCSRGKFESISTYKPEAAHPRIHVAFWTPWTNFLFFGMTGIAVWRHGDTDSPVSLITLPNLLCS